MDVKVSPGSGRLCSARLNGLKAKKELHYPVKLMDWREKGAVSL